MAAYPFLDLAYPILVWAIVGSVFFLSFLKASAYNDNACKPSAPEDIARIEVCCDFKQRSLALSNKATNASIQTSNK